MAFILLFQMCSRIQNSRKHLIKRHFTKRSKISRKDQKRLKRGFTCISFEFRANAPKKQEKFKNKLKFVKPTSHGPRLLSDDQEQILFNTAQTLFSASISGEQLGGLLLEAADRPSVIVRLTPGVIAATSKTLVSID